jgi:hypothetical protein
VFWLPPTQQKQSHSLVILPGLRIVKAYFVIASHFSRVPVSGVGLGKVSQDWHSIGSSQSKVDAHVIRLTSVDNLQQKTLLVADF